MACNGHLGTEPLALMFEHIETGDLYSPGLVCGTECADAWLEEIEAAGQVECWTVPTEGPMREVRKTISITPGMYYVSLENPVTGVVLVPDKDGNWVDVLEDEIIH